MLVPRLRLGTQVREALPQGPKTGAREKPFPSSTRGLTAFAHVEITRNFGHAERYVNLCDAWSAPAQGRFVGEPGLRDSVAKI